MIGIMTRSAAVCDAAVLSRIHARSWKSAFRGLLSQVYLDELAEDFWVAVFTDWLGTGKVRARLAEKAGYPVACICYGGAREEERAEWGEIISLYVLPGECRQGWGGLLLKEAITELTLCGRKRIYLWVAAENRSAREFYQRQGFADSGESCWHEAHGSRLLHCRYVWPTMNERDKEVSG